jgi:hypothetical protein
VEDGNDPDGKATVDGTGMRGKAREGAHGKGTGKVCKEKPRCVVLPTAILTRWTGLACEYRVDVENKAKKLTESKRMDRERSGVHRD